MKGVQVISSVDSRLLSPEEGRLRVGKSAECAAAPMALETFRLCRILLLLLMLVGAKHPAQKPAGLVRVGERHGEGALA